MGGNYATPPPQSTADTLSAYSQYLPGLIGETANGTNTIAQANLDAAQSTQPGYNALNLQQLLQYGVPLAQAGQAVTKSNALSGGDINSALLNGSGGDAAKSAYNLNRQLNPDYYKAQDAASEGAARAVGAINLDGLSPGEAAATERANNQRAAGTGNLGLDNNSNAIANAMNFGGAFNNKIGLLNNAVSSASGAANSAASNGNFNAVGTALGSPTATGNNFGTGTFSGANSGTSSGASGNSFGFGGGLLSNITGSNNALTGSYGQQSVANINTGSPSAYLGSVCCFIFLEAYKGRIPKHVRRARDRYYSVNHDIATGYRRMAKWLVPLMQQYSIVRYITWHFMVAPITEHTGSFSSKNKKITKEWLKFWSWYGKGKQESSYAMEWHYPTERSV